MVEAFIRTLFAMMSFHIGEDLKVAPPKGTA